MYPVRKHKLSRLEQLYVERFNQRDWNGLREVIAADAQLRVADKFADRLDKSHYFGNYEGLTVPWQTSGRLERARRAGQQRRSRWIQSPPHDCAITNETKAGASSSFLFRIMGPCLIYTDAGRVRRPPLNNANRSVTTCFTESTTWGRSL